MVSDIKAELEAQQRRLLQQVGARERVERQLKDARARHASLTEDAEVLELTQQLALALEGQWRKAFEASLEEVVSDGLTLVFGESMYLHIQSGVKNGASAVSFTIETSWGETPIINSVGGSAVELVSFLLRLMVVLSHRPELRKVLLLDEAFGGFNEENVPHVAKLLRQLVDETGMQIIFVTQDRQYADVADVVLDVTRVKGRGKVVVLKTARDEVA